MFALSAKRNALFSYAMGLLLGFFVFHLLFDATIFLNYDWGLDVPTDLMQHIAGFYALRSAPWGFPLLYTNVLGYPEGVSVYFTDSIPLLALLFKLLSPLFSADFHYFKWWILIAFLLQPLAAIYLIRTLGHSQIRAAFFAGAFSLLVKWLIFRGGHSALCGQFLILYALAFYYQQTRAAGTTGERKRLVIKWMILIVLSFLIHLYLFVMVIGLFFAAVLDFRVESSSKLSILFYKFNLLLLPCLLFPILYGVFISSNSYTELQPADGYGYFSLNITGPIYGGRLIPLPDKWGPSDGQIFEDQSYLGLGLILLIVLAVFLGRGTLLSSLKKHPFLILLFLGFYLFALSTDVYLGVERVYRTPEFITQWILSSPFSQFRASARFFWPVGYGLLFFSLATVLKRRWALPVLACLLLIQWIDLPKPYSPRPEGYANAFNADLAYWDALTQGKKSLYLYPTLFCGGDATRVNIPILLMAAKNGVPSNTVFVTRYSENCDQKIADGLANISAGSLHIFTTPGNALSQRAFQSFIPEWCSSRAELTVCIPYPSKSDRELLQKIDQLVFKTISPLNFP